MHDVDEGGINWKRTGLIVGAVAALGLGTQLIPDIDMSLGGDNAAERTETVAERTAEQPIAAQREDESASVDSGTGALPSANDPEARLEALGARMEVLAERLETATGDERDQIEEEMGDLGAEMAKAGIDMARDGLREAFGE